jgi:hypothetical protein
MIKLLKLGRYMMGTEKIPVQMELGIFSNFNLFRLFAAHSYPIDNITVFRIGNSKLKITINENS